MIGFLLNVVSAIIKIFMFELSIRNFSEQKSSGPRKCFLLFNQNNGSSLGKHVKKWIIEDNTVLYLV